MRLLVVGSDSVYAIENYYIRYLRELGVIVDLFRAQNIFYDYYNMGGPVRKTIFKAGLSSIIKDINTLFREAIQAYQPDIIWVFKGMEILPESLRQVRRQGIKLVNYNPDNPFIFTGSGSGNKNVQQSIGLYDLHFTYNLSIKQQLQDSYKVKTALLPFGYDISDELYAICANQTEVVKACFLGNPDKQRAILLHKLAELGVFLDVYGHNWGKFVYHANIQVFPAVLGDDLWKTLRRYRVQINLMRVHNEDSHNMRTFEIPGVGGIQLAPDTTEHRIFFEEGREIFLYSNAAQCADLVSDLLHKDQQQINLLRNFARNAVIEKKYSYRDRTMQALNEMNRLFE